MKPFIAVISSGKYLDRRVACRETWLANSPLSYKFFVGRGGIPEADDVVVLDVPDDINGICKKVFAMLKWVYDTGHESVFKCDDDSYVVLTRLASSGFDSRDAVGCNCGQAEYRLIQIDRDLAVHTSAGYLHGGSGVLWSRKSMKIILDDGRLAKRKDKFEDLVIPALLTSKGIELQHDDRLQIEHAVCPLLSNDLISCHHCSPADLRQIHAWYTGAAEYPIKSKFELGQKIRIKEPAAVYTYPRGFSPRSEYIIVKNKQEIGVTGEKTLLIPDYAGEAVAWRFVEFQDGIRGWVDESCLEST